MVTGSGLGSGVGSGGGGAEVVVGAGGGGAGVEDETVLEDFVVFTKIPLLARKTVGWEPSVTVTVTHFILISVLTIRPRSWRIGLAAASAALQAAMRFAVLILVVVMRYW